MNPIARIFNRITRAFSGGGSRFIYVPAREGGVYVDHETALTFSAVFACQRYLASSVAQLPWRVYRRKNEGGSDLAATHPTDYLLHTRPNPEMRAFDFRRLMVHWASGWGNGYAEIERDASNRAMALWPIHPERVTVKRDEVGTLYYEVSNGTGPKTNVMPDSMFHLAGMGGDGIQGYSVISLARVSIGAGMAADKFSASFFANGAVMSGGLRTDQALRQEAYDRLKEDFSKKHAGPDNAWKPLILEQGLQWQTFGMPLKDAEFLAGQKFRVTDVCRWFGVPPHKVADLERATYSNIEHQAIEVVTDALMPWILPLEQEADAKLISQRNRGIFYSKMIVNGLLRGDSTARSAWYQTFRNMGAISADEIRELEDMNPIGAAKGGDKYIVQGQYVPLEDVGKEPEQSATLPITEENGNEQEDQDNQQE